MEFVWSDAVILLAVCGRNDCGGSDRASIIDMGGFVARSHLTDVEYFGGVFRLLDAGHIYIDDERIFADEAALHHCGSPPAECEDVDQWTEHMMRFLGITWPHLTNRCS